MHSYVETHDELTGLPNRRCIDDLAQALHLDAHADLVVVLIELPCLSDALRKAIATRLRACARGDDMIARVGDDRYAMLLTPRIGADEESKLLARLSTAIGIHVLGITAAFGIARCPEDGTNIEQLLAHASAHLREPTVAH
jgi:GGDEF domain-containing protein